MEALMTENLPEYDSAGRRTIQRGRHAGRQDVAQGYDVEEEKRTKLIDAGEDSTASR